MSTRSPNNNNNKQTNSHDNNNNNNNNNSKKPNFTAITDRNKNKAKHQQQLQQQQQQQQHQKHQQKQQQQQQRRYLSRVLVLDFEATCEKDRTNYPHEIIEIPIVLLDGNTGEIIDEFHEYVRPTLNPRLSAFCTELTGIDQDKVDNARTLLEVLQNISDWMVKHNLLHSETLGETELFFSFATDGPWDFRDFLLPQCQRLSLPVPWYFYQWVNIRQHFADFFGCRRMNVVRMLQWLNKNFEGRRHSGIDDARNIAAVATELIQRGCVLTINERIKM